MSFQTPTFFAWDGLQTYANGNITSLGNDYSWALSGGFTVVSFVVGMDNFDEYTDGELPTPDGGSFWAEDGTTTLVT